MAAEGRISVHKQNRDVYDRTRVVPADRCGAAVYMRRLWVPHPDQVWAPCWLHDSIDGIATFGTEEGEALEIPAVSVNDLEEVHQQQVVGEEDVCLLDTVTKAALLHTIRVRFSKQFVYTWVSRILLAVNPFQVLPLYSSQVLDQYRFASEVRALPPHIFSIAADAMSNLRTSRRHQAIVINGESGAGKTESAKLIMSFIAEATKSDSQEQTQSFEEKVLRTNPIMEAFGNAMTVRNNNSSRFVKWLNFHTQDGRLVGCEVQQYLLEDTRICSVAKGERSYHIFFQLLQARQSPLLKDLELEGPEGYAYTRCGELTVPGIDDLQAFEELKEALDALGIGKSTQAQMWQILSAVLWLGNCRFSSEAHHEGVKFEDEKPVQQAARMLGLQIEDLKKCLLVRKITVGKDLVETPQRAEQAKAARDSLSKWIYMQLFVWAVESLNQTLKVDSSSKSRTSETQALGILDIAGFESFEHNSLEQLLINLCNEHLQQFFNNFVFRSELEDYAKEGLSLDCEVNFVDNKEVLQLLDGRAGILDVLDEEVVMPKASDESFASKVKTGQAQHPRLVKPKTGGKLLFGVRHFAGEVMYNCEGFLQKNVDKPPEDFIKLIPSSSLELLKELAKDSEVQPSQASKNSGRKPKSTSAKFRLSLRQLIGKIDVSDPHFVRCIKPNTEKVPNKFNSPLVLEQLLFSGILEAVQIRQKGFASRASFDDFLKRYSCIASVDTKTMGATDLVKHFMEKLKLDAGGMQVGKTKVFLKASVLDRLEAALAASRYNMALRLQAVMRSRQARKHFAAARPATKALKESLRRVGWDDSSNVERLGVLVNKLGSEAKAFLAELRKAESALPNYPSSQRLREAAQAITARLTKELQCVEHMERLQKSTDAMEIEKALARAEGLKLPKTPVTLDLQSRCKALQVQMPLKQALQSAVNDDDSDALARVVAEVEKKGLNLQAKSWLLELDMAVLVGQVAAKTQPVKPQEPTAPTPTPAQPAEESTVEKKPSPFRMSRRSSRRQTFTGFSDAQQLQLLASLEQAAEELDSVVMEQLLEQAMRNGIDEADLQEYHKLLCRLQDESFLRSTVEQVLEEIKGRCPPRNALQKLQNLSHQLRILHGDAELIRAAARGAQQGTRRRTKSFAANADPSRRQSVLDVSNVEELRVACESFRDLSSFSKLKSEGTWKGHRNSLLQHVQVDFNGSMLGHSKVTIAESLTHIPKSREAVAVQNFRNIVIWMGDRPAQECQRIASRESVVDIASSDPLMRDEVFMQLLKQLSGNPSPRSEWLGWQLLLQICKATMPSDELDDFVRFFCAQKMRRAPASHAETDASNWEIARIAAECFEALAAALPRPADSDVSGDMVGVLVHLVDKSSQNLFVPVATTLKELSSLMGSRVGVKHWRDFAFFQATNRSDSLRMLPDMLPVSELINMWQQIREATNLRGHLHWLRRFLRPQEMLLAGDLHHAALTFRQAVRSHLGRPVPCQAGAEAEEMATAAALMWLECYNPSQKIKDNDALVCQLLKGQMSGLKPAQQDEVRRMLLAKVHDMRSEFGPRIPQLQRMTRAFALMRCFPFFGAHRWSAKVIAPAKVNAGQMVVNNPPDRFLTVHARQTEPDVWVFVDMLGLHLAPAMTSHTNGAGLWSFHFQPDGAVSMLGSDLASPVSCFTPASAASRRRSMTSDSTFTDDGGSSTVSAAKGRRNLRLHKQVGRLLRWGAKPGVLQLVVHSADIGRSVLQTQLVALACPDAMDVGSLARQRTR
eukprot:s161_g6.t2